MAQFNKQASDFIFRENNANGRVPDDTIDLHGQFVEEAEDILEERIKYARHSGQTHLHVYVHPDGYFGLELMKPAELLARETIPITIFKRSNLESRKSARN